MVWAQISALIDTLLRFTLAVWQDVGLNEVEGCFVARCFEFVFLRRRAASLLAGIHVLR